MSPDQELSGCLFIVATPIGNLGDLSQRAAHSIENSDIIACEDTRVTAKLLQHLNLRIPMVSYREENERKKSQEEKKEHLFLLHCISFAVTCDLYVFNIVFSPPPDRSNILQHYHSIRKGNDIFDDD